MPDRRGRHCVPTGLLADHRDDGGLVAGKCSRAGEHLEQHGADRPDVRAFIDGLPARLLRRHVSAVPRIIPACVVAGVVIVGDIDMFGDELAAGSIAFAKPKSSTFTVPSGRTLMFAGA